MEGMSKGSAGWQLADPSAAGIGLSVVLLLRPHVSDSAAGVAGVNSTIHDCLKQASPTHGHPNHRVTII